MELVQTVLPLLALLACPLMMGFCVLGMRKMGCGTPATNEAQARIQTREERMAALEAQLATIRTELAESQVADDQAQSSGTPAANRQRLTVIPEMTHAARHPI